ncbi:MAG: sugar porter family MFS transporter [Planctomycetia bacterium]|nr:sugar porter family MFS transporter [Planctomycetia bacterium]
MNKKEIDSKAPKSPKPLRWASLIYIVVVSALGGLLFGFDSGVISGCEKGMQREYFPVIAQKADQLEAIKVELNEAIEANDTAQISQIQERQKAEEEKKYEGEDRANFLHGFTVSVALIGTLIGAFGVGRPSDRFGRKKTLFVMALLYLISAVGCAFPPNWETLVLMRFLGGIAIGGSSVVVPLYIVEIAPGHVRGRLVAMNQLNIVLGILVSYISNYYVALAIDNHTVVWSWCESLAGLFASGMSADAIKWRLMFGVEAFPAFLFFLLLFSIPESPRWLMRFGRRDEARKVLESIGGTDPEETLDDIAQSLANASHGENVPLFQRKYLWPIFLAWSVAMFNQLSGINAINYYAPRIFEMFRFESQAALASTIGLGAINLTFTILAFLFIDKLGRRALLMFGALGTCAMHLLAAWQISLGSNANPWIAIPAILGFIAFFAVSQGAVIWVFIAEIFPNAVRAKGQALGSFTHWFMCTIISWIFPFVVGLSETSGSYVFVFFAAMTLLQFFFAWKLMPETKGGELESLEKKILNA